MAREKKDAKLLSMRLDRNIHERLEFFCAETGMTKTMAIEKILDKYLRTYFQRPEEERKLF